MIGAYVRCPGCCPVAGNRAVLREAVAKTATDAKAIELLIKTGDYYETQRVGYTGGEKYPHLLRVEGTEDLLAGILAARGK